MSFANYFDGATVVVTGASSGLGEEFARQLAARAGRLILVARRGERLEALRAELVAARPELRVECRAVDLADEAAREALGRELAAEGADGLINNAGLGDIGKFASAEEEKIAAMLEVNIAALTTLTRAVLPGMRRRGRGAILNVSSLSAVLPLPRLAVYAATKAYVSSFTESLRAELRGTGVRVTAVCPGPVDTEFGAVANRRQKKDLPLPGWMKVTKEQVVGEALRAVARDRARVFPGFVARALALYLSALPLAVLRRLLPVFVK